MTRPFHLRVQGFLTAAALLLTAPLWAQQPSFNCAKAGTPTEHAICASPLLSALDHEIAEAYKAKRATLGNEARAALLAEQRSWLKTRDLCGDVVACISAQMQHRQGQLGVPPGMGNSHPASLNAGRWQPYSRTATAFYSAMTLSSTRLTYDNGLTYELHQIRPASTVYRVRHIAGRDPGSCSGGPLTHIAFVLDRGLLQQHDYRSATDPADPVSMTAATVPSGQTSPCGIYVFSR